MPLEIDLGHKLNLDLQRDIVGRRIAVLGVSGQGKTNTAAVLIEELLTAGLPMTIADIEGEYWGLKEKFEILVVGSGEHTDFRAGPEQAGALATLSVVESIPMILDLSDFKPGEQTEFLLAYFSSLWEAVSKKRTPYEVIIEEAHEFIPEGVRTPLKEQLTMIALRGRKRGLGAIIMSQRSASVAKSFLTQAEMLFLHRVVHPTDLRVYKDLIPLPTKEVEELVGNLRPGQVVYVYNHQAGQVQIRPRHTFHAGATPQLDAQVATRLKTIDKSLLAKLAKVVKAPAGTSGQASRVGNEDQLEKRVRELEEERGQLQAKVADQAQQIAILKELKVSLEARFSTFKVPVQTSAAAKSVTEQKAHLVAGQTKNLETKIAELPKERQAAVNLGAEKMISDYLRAELNDYDRKRLKPFITKLGQFSDREASLLEFLMEYDGKFFSRNDLFKYTGIHMGHFTRDFPTLLSLPFVESQGVQMRSLIKEWAKFASPGVEPDVIFKVIRANF
jgi:hypothetical protein